MSALRGSVGAVLRNPQLTVSLVIIAGCFLAILGARFITSANSIAQHVLDRLQSPSLAHPFGTDQLGRDVLARVLYGGRASVPAAIIVVMIGASFGTLVGAVAGYAGRAVDEIVMRLTDIVLAFPILVLAMALAAALGASLAHGVVALIVVWWPQYARVCRGIVLDLRDKDYVTAARAAGRSWPGVLFQVIMPNALPSLMVMAAVDVGRAILNFSILSFLGLGAKPPQPEWGSMVSSGAEVMDQWWVATFPGLAILAIVFGFNLLGDSIRDALDPWTGNRRS
ncbi:MAG TPA: ABC transporter permease [Lichenihabitans sp.]|nr:ABC transporter permease [Lichenihabitans sp.]